MTELQAYFKSEQYRSYRSLPFWSWNDKLEQTTLLEQLQWMQKNGTGGAFMHARSGLQTEYLSDEWMQCIEACARESERLGLKAWIYDENGWPSGFVGGKLLEDEKNRDKYILQQIGDFDSSATVSYLITETQLIRASEGGADGEYLNLYIHTAASTVDILNPEVVGKFLTLTHEKYKERFGEEFSQKIEGFFTDEPQYYRWKTPYTEVMAQYFKSEYQEDILDGLGLLFVEKEGYRAFRYKYWKTMQKLMLDSFAKQLYTWCDTNGVKLTGHYIEENSLGGQMLGCAGVMPFYEYEHIPGIDWLGKRSDNPLGIKQVGSVAAQLGKKQVLTETFGCCGWDVLPTELRRIAGFQYVNGANMLCHHLLPYSERGNRKYDFPAHYSDINPWVKEDFKLFNDYFTRLGYLLGEGEQHVKVAMLHPMRSVYFGYKRELATSGYGISEWNEQLLQACKMLSSRGIDFHFLDETLLEKYGFVENKRIGCGKCAYDYLVLPSMLTMDKSTEHLIHKYVEQGGKVLLLGEKPIYLEAEAYSYDYLQSNVTLEEIVGAQRYRVSNYETDIYSTYRNIEGKEMLYVVNSSAEKSYAQTFDCGEHIKSFVRVDLTDLSETQVPLTLTLKPGEDALLFFSSRQVSMPKKLVPYQLRFEDADVSVHENYMPVDYIRYSTDGKTFTEPWPCAALFQKLLKDKYQGKIFFRYDFEVQVLPEKIYLRTEKSNDIAAWFNDQLLLQTVATDENYVNCYDITTLVKKGTNTYVAEVEWYEDESVHYALFGENVTESLKNCIVYNTELQPIELVGQFGVYPVEDYTDDEDVRFVNGKDFYIGKLPERVTEPSMEGLPFLAGEMILRQKVIFDATNILLQVAGEYQTAVVKVNGKTAGKLFFEKELDVSDVACVGENDIEVRFLLGNRNRMGPHHFVGNKNVNVSPQCFELLGAWKENQCGMYHETYDIKKFYSDNK